MLSKILVTLAIAVSGVLVHAQQVDVNGVNTDAEETTITVKKGKSGVAAVQTCQPLYQIESGTEEIVGDGAPMNKPARANWKKACDTWKKEFQSMNKDNRIITINCGSATCGPEGAETVCKSSATYKVRIKLD